MKYYFSLFIYHVNNSVIPNSKRPFAWKFSSQRLYQKRFFLQLRIAKSKLFFVETSSLQKSFSNVCVTWSLKFSRLFKILEEIVIISDPSCLNLLSSLFYSQHRLLIFKDAKALYYFLKQVTFLNQKSPVIFCQKIPFKHKLARISSEKFNKVDLKRQEQLWNNENNL